MNSSRLKNIVIAILALVNLFLLALLLARGVQEHSVRTRTETQLIQLYAASGVELPASLIPKETPHLAPADPVRSLGSEAALAGAILGDCAAEDVGGGIYRYHGEAGTCLIRASGVVEASLGRAVDDPETFFEGLFSAFGYAALYSDLQSDGTGTVAAVRMLPGGMVFNARLELSFTKNVLTSVTGAFVPAVETPEGENRISGVTALVRFLDYSNSGGEVCTAVTDVRSGYLLQSTASASQRLLPAWCITTDVNQYYINMNNGEVTREA